MAGGNVDHLMRAAFLGMRGAERVTPDEPETFDLMGRQVPLSRDGVSAEAAAGLGRDLPAGQRLTVMSGVNMAFNLLDMPRALIAGLAGAGTAAVNGNFSESGRRLLSAVPGSEQVPLLINTIFGTNMAPVRATWGEEILTDLGMTPGTTSDDERRIRIAMAAGMNRWDAERLFATRSDKIPLSFERQQEFDRLLHHALERNPELDTGVTWADSKKAADMGDVAGLGLDILIDPLTYLSFGASAAGRVARLGAQAERAGAKGVVAGLTGARNVDEARNIVRAIDVDGFGPKAKAKDRMLNEVDRAFREGRSFDFELGATIAEQHKRGQWAGRFSIPFTDVRLSPDFRVAGVPDVLSTLGQSRAARELAIQQTGSPVPLGVNDRIYEAFSGRWTAPIRGAIEAGRKFVGRTGVDPLDRIVRDGADVGRIGAREQEILLGEQIEAIRATATRTGVPEADVRRTVLEAVEASRAMSDSLPAGVTRDIWSTVAERQAEVAARYAATLSRTGLKESDIAPIASGMAAINKNLMTAAGEFDLPLNALTDESLGYMHRMLTPEARKFLKDNPGAAKKRGAGIVFDARSGMFQGRLEKWQGKMITAINEEMEDVLGKGVRFFSEDPIAATRYAIHETHRRAGNAYVVARVFEEFGDHAPAEVVEELAEAALYRAMGRVDDAEAAVARAREAQSSFREARPELRRAARQAERDAAAAREGADAVRPVAGAPRELRASLSVEQSLRRMFPGAEAIADDAEAAMRAIADAVARNIEAAPTKGAGTVLTREKTRRAQRLMDKFFRDYQGAASTSQYRKAVRDFESGLKAILPAAEMREISRMAERAGKQLDRLTHVEGAVGKPVAQAVAARTRAAEAALKKARERLAKGQEDPVTLFRKQDRVENSALDLYEAAHIRVTSVEEAARLSQTPVPAEIYNAITKAVEFQKAPAKFWQPYEAFTRWMKLTVTQPFLAYHGRNMLENTFKAVIEGNINRQNYRDARRIVAALLDTVGGRPGAIGNAGRAMSRKLKDKFGKVPPEVMQLLKDEGGFRTWPEFEAWAKGVGLVENKLTSEFGMDMTRHMAGAQGPGAEEKARNLFSSAAHGFGTLDAAFHAGSASENLYRVSHFLDRLRKGFGREGALNDVKRVYFDYRDLGRAESLMARRFGFFYNFYRNNLRYMVQKGMQNPVQSKLIMRLFQDDPDSTRQSWLSDFGSFKVAGYEVALGFVPQQQFNMFSLHEGDVFDKIGGKFGSAAGMSNPVLQNIGAMAFNTDLWTGQQLSHLDRAPDLTFAPQAFQDMIGLRETTNGNYVMDPRWRFAMASVPGLARRAQTQIMLDKEETELYPALVRLMTGVRVERDDIERGSIAALNRNIEAEGNRLERDGRRLMRRTGHARYAIDRRTPEGRVASALLKRNQTQEDLEAAFTVDEIAARLLPYVTVRDDGSVQMSQILRAKMNDLGRDLYPREWALMEVQRLRDNARTEEVGRFTVAAREQFGQRFPRAVRE
jgi:hypothetical protein